MKRFVNGEEVELDDSFETMTLADRVIVKGPDGAFSGVAVRVGDSVQVSYRGSIYTVDKTVSRAKTGKVGSGEMRAPMPGQVVDILAKAGDQVEKGDKVLVLEAMKTQQAFTAPFAGRVESISAVKGQQVAEGQILVVIKELV